MLFLLVVAALCSSALAGALTQYTPNLANWTTFYTKVGANARHDPDGITWISNATWVAARWDGVTRYNPSTMSATAFFQAICVNGSPDVIRGIREVFYRANPFADIRNPTKAEVDEWHRIAINHVRNLVNYTTPDRQATPDHCMHIRA